MKVLIDVGILSRASFGGVVRYVTSLVGALVKEGVHVQLLAERPEDVRQRFPDGAHLLASGLEAEEAEIVHVPVGPVPWRAKTATVVTVHDLISETVPKELFPETDVAQYSQGTECWLADADHVIAVSDTTRQGILDHYDFPPDRVSTVPHGVGPVFRADSLPEDSDTVASLGIKGPFLLHVGGREGYKNFTSLLRAFAGLSLRYRCQLVAAGSQARLLPQECPLVAAYDLADRLILTGCVDDRTLASLYRTAAVVTLPSLCEGFGLPLIEAMASGALVACSTTPALRELGGDVPFYFDPEDPKAIEAAIQEALAEPTEARRQAARTRACTYDWQHTARKTILVYRRAVERFARRRQGCHG